MNQYQPNNAASGRHPARDRKLKCPSYYLAVALTQISRQIKVERFRALVTALMLHSDKVMSNPVSVRMDIVLHGRTGPPGSGALARWAGWSAGQVGRHVEC